MKQQLFAIGGAYALGLCTFMVLGTKDRIAETPQIAEAAIEQGEVVVQLTALDARAPVETVPLEEPQVRRKLRASISAEQSDSPVPLNRPRPSAISYSDEAIDDDFAIPKNDRTLAQVRPRAPTMPQDAFDPRVDQIPEQHRIVDLSDVDLQILAPAAPSEEESATLTTLREELVKLATEKANRMNQPALEAEISRLQREIANLNAARQLLDAQQVLQKLIDEFPESPAATRARGMLAPPPKLQPTPDTIRGNSVPINAFPTY